MGLFFSSDGNQRNSGGNGSNSYFEDSNAASKNVESLEPLNPKDRARAAIIGAFVADSLSAYSSNDQNDDDKFISNFEDREQISDTPIIKSASPHSRHLGHQSFYGEEAFPFLQLISTRGYFEHTDACEEAFQLLSIFKEKDGAHSNVHPLMKEFYDRRMEGHSWENCSSREDVNFVSITKVPILVARYAGSPNLLEKVEDAVRIYQTHPKVLAACRLSSRLLERVVLGNSVAEALHWATSLAEESEQTSSSKFLSEGQGSTRTKVTSTPHMISSSATEALDEDEREFLASILPVRVAAITSENYGSFQDLGDASSESEAYADSDRNTLYQNNGTDASRTGTGTGVGTGLGLGLGLGLGNAWSTDSSCVDATGALTYYLACTRSPETKRLKGDSPKKSLGFHHRRALRGNGTGPMETRTVPFSLAVEEIGCSAQLPECLQASLYGLHTFHSYKTAVRANIMTGGDNVCRSWLIGAMLAAEQGDSSIPIEWQEQTLLHTQIATMANRLAGSNPYFETLKEKGCHLSVLLT